MVYTETAENGTLNLTGLVAVQAEPRMTPYMMDLRILIVAAILVYSLLARGQSGEAAIVNLRISVIHCALPIRRGGGLRDRTVDLQIMSLLL